MTTTKLRAVLHSYQYVTFSVICLYFVEICMYHAEAYTVTVYLSVWLGWMCKLCCWLPQLWTSESPCRPGMLYMMCYRWMLSADWHIESHVLEHFLYAQKNSYFEVLLIQFYTVTSVYIVTLYPSHCLNMGSLLISSWNHRQTVSSMVEILNPERITELKAELAGSVACSDT